MEAEGKGETVAAGEGTAHTPRPVPGLEKTMPGAANSFPATAAEDSRAGARNLQARRTGWVPTAPGPRRAGASGQREGGLWARSPHTKPGAAEGAERQRLPGSFGAAALGMAQGPGEELAPRGRTGYSEVVRAEGRLFPGLSVQQRRGRPPGVSALPWDPHPSTLRPLPPPPPRPPPPPPPRRPPRPLHTLSHHATGEPLPLIRHFRAQVVRSGPGAGGCS